MLTKLKIERQKRGIKAKDLAMNACIDPSYVTLIEKGRVPSARVKGAIARVLRLPQKAIWD